MLLQVTLQARLEFIEQQRGLISLPLTFGGNLHVDQGCTGFVQGLQGHFHGCGGIGVDGELAAQYADTCALQRLRFEARMVVQRGIPGRIPGGGIRIVTPGQYGQQQCSIGNAARHRSRAVLAVGNRQDAITAYQPHRGLQTDQPVHCGGAQDAAIRFCANSRGGKVGGYRDRTAGTGTTGIAIQCIRVAGLAAARTPAGSGAAGAEVRPFAQVGLTQDHRAGFAQSFHQEGICQWPEILERQRAGRVGHGRRADVVLQQDGYAMQRATYGIGLALHVAQRGFLQCIGVQLDDRIELRAGLVDLGDAFKVGSGERAAVQLAPLHALLQVGDIDLGVDEIGGLLRSGFRCHCGGRGLAAGSQCR